MSEELGIYNIRREPEVMGKVRIIQPTMNLRWFEPINKDFLPFLQQQWVCMQDGSTEWKRVEVVKEGEE